MKWSDIFGTRKERQEDRVETRSTALFAFCVLVAALLVAWLTAQWSDGPGAVFYAALGIATLAGLMLLQEGFNLLLAHTIGLKPLLILVVLAMLSYGVLNLYLFLGGS